MKISARNLYEQRMVKSILKNLMLLPRRLAFKNSALFFVLFFLSRPLIADTAENYLHSAIAAHDQSNEFHEWVDSPLYPEALFQYLQEQQQSASLATSPSSPDQQNVFISPEDLCLALRKLSLNDLQLFYSALENSPDVAGKDCSRQLLSQTQLSWSYFRQTWLLSHNSVNPAEGGLALQELNSQHKEASKLFYSSSLSRPSPLQHFETRVEWVSPVGGPVFWYGDKKDFKDKEIALTFDDGPHKSLTEQLLQILASEDIRATFFVLGKNALRYPSVLQDTLAAGHTISNHTQNHQNLPKFSNAFGEDEVHKGFESILSVTGQVAPFFRFPYGANTKYLKQYLHDNNYATFYWDVDTTDWKIKDHQTLLNFAHQEIVKAKRGIVLFHDIQPQTIAIMPLLINQLKIEGYKFVVFEPTSWVLPKVEDLLFQK